MRARVFVAVFVSSCAASPFPENLARSADRALTLRELRTDTTAHLGARVILGGEVLATTPKPGETEIEVLSRPLRAGVNGVRSCITTFLIYGTSRVPSRGETVRSKT